MERNDEYLDPWAAVFHHAELEQGDRPWQMEPLGIFPLISGATLELLGDEFTRRSRYPDALSLFVAESIGGREQVQLVEIQHPELGRIGYPYWAWVRWPSCGTMRVHNGGSWLARLRLAGFWRPGSLLR